MLANNESYGRQSGAIAQALAPGGGSWREEIIRLLKDALIAELLNVLRHDRLSNVGAASGKVDTAFQDHVDEVRSHAHHLVRRIVQLGGELEYFPEALMQWRRKLHEPPSDPWFMVEDNLLAQRMVILSYGRIGGMLDEQDVTTRRLLLEIMGDEQKHAEALQEKLSNKDRPGSSALR